LLSPLSLIHYPGEKGKELWGNFEEEILDFSSIAYKIKSSRSGGIGRRAAFRMPIQPFRQGVSVQQNHFADNN